MKDLDKAYADLAAKMSDPDYEIPAGGGVPKTGAAAEAEGLRFMLDQYGSMEAIEHAVGRRGRPRVGEGRGASPAVRGRISDVDYAAFKKLEEATGRTQSALVREAVHRLLVDHKLVS